jgi:Trypsin-like peptidase domain
VESWRVAQIVADRRGGIDSFRGSGYLVAPGVVLTAAHVLGGASAVRVRLDVGQQAEIEVPAERWWADPDGHHGTDLAVVIIPADVTAGRDVERARFGRISDCTAVLAVQALGFPRFKLRGAAGEPEVFRDLDQVTGHAPVAANRRQGTLAVYLDDPPPTVPDGAGPSPWEGMSGAAVWAGSRIIGVVAEHHASEGAGRLTARRIDRAYERLRESDLDRLVTWLGLVPAARGLPDVVPAAPGQLLQSAYLEQVRDLTPDTLIGRAAALAELAEFCAGSEAYVWWQAGQWSGKSALASWFVTHPPVGVDVVSFFITGRLAGQADSNAFLDAMIDQLNALAPAGLQSPPVAGARVGIWLRLLADAAAQAEERARRLVVVVDGLDEDEAGASPPRGRPSIASLLPRRPPPGARFIITSRPGPGVPDDVPPGHPLRTCVHRHLPVSRVAEDTERLAKQELRDLLAGDQTAIDVVGYVAGSGGGLTRNELSELIGAPPHELDSVLRGVFGRSLQTRPSAYFRDGGSVPATRVHLFAHETLRATAEEQLGSRAARYRQGVHDWIHTYADRRWPDITPGYAVRGYPRLLTATKDVPRLSALALDPCRHAFLRRATGSDYAALTEISDAQRVIAAQEVPDLRALVELAIYRHAISIRNQSIPPGLPAVWARLGRFDHAEALARAITDHRAQDQALAELVTIVAHTGDLDYAEALARAITGPDAQAQALAQLANAAVQARHINHASRLAADAEALVRTSTYSPAQTRALTQLATVAVQTGDLDRAEAPAQAITDPWDQAEALIRLAAASGQEGNLDRAEAAARAVTDPRARARALVALAAAAAQAGDPGRASRLAADAEAAARAVTDPRAQAQALAELATAIAQAGDLDRAEYLARAITGRRAQAPALVALAAAAAQAGNLDRAEVIAGVITDPREKARALAGVAAAAARAGDLDRASRLAADGEAHAITDHRARAQALVALAAAAAQAGDLDCASRLAADAEAATRAITDPDGRPLALAAVVTAIAQAGDLDRAEALARAITSRRDKAQALAAVVTAAAQAGNLDRAEALACAIADPREKARALTAVATAAAQAGDPDRAEALARATADPREKARALTAVATAAAQAGDRDRAEALARAITSRHDRAQALTAVAAAVARGGDLDRAEALARAITTRRARERALAELVTAIAQAGDLDRAEALARGITDSRAQTRALTALATAAVQTGHPVRASRLAADAEAAAHAITDANARLRALVVLATAGLWARDPDRASQIVGDAHARVIAITDADAQARAFATLAAAAAQAGDLDRAEDLACAITEPAARAQALATLGADAARAGDLGRASRLAADAETLARAITDPDSQARALTQLATTATEAGDADRARHLLALATSVDAREIGSWAGTVSRLFPSVIKDARGVFLRAYRAKA